MIAPHSHACCSTEPLSMLETLCDPLAPLAPVDLPAAEKAVRDLLFALGEDPTREGLIDTPRRVAKAFTEMLAGRHEHPADHLHRTFAQESEEVVILRDIEYTSLCEHHFLPFIGKAHIAYLPDHGQVVGLSKLARLVDVFARRPQLQERMTNQIADALVEHLDPRGVAVVIHGEHMCMKLRGARKMSPRMHTFALRGEFKHNPTLRSEILTMLNTSPT